MGIGRFVCVALPFALTIGSLIALLVAGLGGVADKSMFMFEVNTTDFSISSSDVTNLISRAAPAPAPVLDARVPAPTVGFHDPSFINGGGSSGSSTNITAADLGLYNLYDVGLWGYCYTAQNGTRACTKPAFNWAATALNTTTTNVKSLITATGANITLPTQITDAVSVFGTVARWTEIVFIIAYVALGLELFFGIFANCSRIWSCVTFIVALFTTVAVCGAAALSTAMAVIVVGTVEATAKWYGVTSSFNTRFLIAVWFAAAFALGAGFFWLFTICCCAPDHHSHRRSSRKSRGFDEGEKLMPAGAYQPIHEHGAYNHGQPQYGYVSGAAGPAPRRDMAYEPYSHANV